VWLATAVLVGWLSPGWAATTAWAAVAEAQPEGRATAASGSTATVNVEFLMDGRCTIASAGAGFRSKVTYKPKGDLRRGELRCAFPPVQKGSQVDLRVTLPSGMPEPADSRPALTWRHDGAQWTGTASLTAWPDVIVVSAPDRPLLFWVTVGLAFLVAAFEAWRRYGRRQRLGEPATAATA